MSDDSSRTPLTVVLVGAMIAFVLALTGIALGLWFLGLTGQPPEAADWLGWTYLGVGLLSVVGGELGLRAYRRGRAGDLAGAARLALVASFLPPVQLVLLAGALLCRHAARARSPADPEREHNPFLR